MAPMLRIFVLRKSITIKETELMGDFWNDIDGNLNKMSEGEKLYAEALAHLLDRDTIDYIELLDDAEDELAVAAESAAAYGSE